MKRVPIPGWMAFRQLLKRDFTAQVTALVGSLPPPSEMETPAMSQRMVDAHRNGAFRATVLRMLWKAAQLLVPASLIGALLGRSRSPVRMLAGLIGTAGALALCVALLRDREQPARNSCDVADPQHAVTSAELRGMEAAMLRLASELSDSGPEQMDRAPRA